MIRWKVNNRETPNVWFPPETIQRGLSVRFNDQDYQIENIMLNAELSDGFIFLRLDDRVHAHYQNDYTDYHHDRRNRIWLYHPTGERAYYNRAVSLRVVRRGPEIYIEVPNVERGYMPLSTAQIAAIQQQYGSKFVPIYQVIHKLWVRQEYFINQQNQKENASCDAAPVTPLSQT